MSRTTRYSFNDLKNYKGLRFQIDRPVPDADLNEAQDIIGRDSADLTRMSLGASRATDTSVIHLGYTEGPDEWDITVLANGSFQITAGVLIADGYRYFNPTTLNLGVSPKLVTSASMTYGFLYADVSLDEVDGSEDPTIKFAQMGETAVRTKLKLDFAIVTSVTSFEAAFTALPALPAVPLGQSVQTGYKARIALGRFAYPAGTDPAAYLNNGAGKTVFSNLVQRTVSDMDLLVNTPEAVAWNGSELSVGDFSGDGALATMMAVQLGDRDLTQYLGRSLGLVGNTAPPRFPAVYNAVKSWQIPAGFALGWKAGGDATSRTSQLLSRPQRPANLADGYAAYFDTAVTTTAAAMQIAKLCVDNIAAFSAEPGSRVLCYATAQGELCFAQSGTVIPRSPSGRASLGRIGVAPSAHEVVVAGFGDGAAHLYGTRSLERAIELTWWSNTSSAYAGALHVFMRNGTYSFAPVRRQIGPNTGASPTSLLHLEGSGPEHTSMNAQVVDHTQSEYMKITADTIIIEGVRFTWSVFGGSTSRSYAWSFEGRKVVLRNCRFDCPVKIIADIIVVEDCEGTFSDPTSGARIEHAQGYLGASMLHLKPGALGGRDWAVKNCVFVQGTERMIDRFPVLLLETPAAVRPYTVVVEGCTFDFTFTPVTNRDAPAAISVSGPGGRVVIRRSHFIGHPGCPKGATSALQTAPLSEASPFVNSLVYVFGATATTDYVNMTAAAYVSCVTDRNYNSSLDVESCTFDMSGVGDAIGASDSIMLGALVVASNGWTVRGKNSYAVANVSFTRNTVNLARAYNKPRNYDNFKLLTYGVFVGAIPDGLPISANYAVTPPTTSYAQTAVWSNIRVEDNEFDLGSAPETGGVLYSALAQSWRTYGTTTYASLSAVFSMQLHNKLNTGVYNGKRGAQGVTFCRNHVSSRTAHGSTAAANFFQAPSELKDTGCQTRFVDIQTTLFAGGDAFPTSAVPTTITTGFETAYVTPLQAILSPLIEGNFFDLTRVSSPNFAGGEKAYAIFLNQVQQARVLGNFFQAPNNGGVTVGLSSGGGWGLLAAGNQMLGFGPLAGLQAGSVKDSAAANMLMFADISGLRHTFTYGTDFDET